MKHIELDAPLNESLSILNNSPAYIDLTKCNHPATMNYLEEIKNTLKELSIHPRFPNPLYVVTNKINKFSDLYLIPSLSELAEHFRQISKKPTEKESFISQKATVLRMRIRSSNLVKSLNKLSQYALKHRMIYQMTKEHNFYTKLLDRIMKNE